ncbi:MAG: DUF4381 domain-containing protein [Gammaproteobacteria bacterium]|jgi:hypothetical protein
MESARDRFGDDFGGEQMWGLKELAYPEAIPFWPQTTGWLVVGILLLVLLAGLAWRARRRWLRNSYRREALTSLEMMRSDPARVRQLPFLLRHAALAAYDRSSLASLRGDDWIRWLNQTAGREVFEHGAAETLDRLAYSKQEFAPDEIEPLLAASRDWVRLHRA